MEIKNITNSEKVPFDLEAWSLIKTDKAELVYLILNPGENLELHKNPFDVIFFVFSGSGKLLLDQDEKTLTENDSIFIGSSTNRGWRNESKERLIVLVYKILT